MYELSIQKNTPTFHDLQDGMPHIAAREVSQKLREIALAEIEGLTELERYPVPDEFVSWDIPFDEYQPPRIDVPRANTRFRKQGDIAGPDDPTRILSFSTLERVPIQRDQQGNPRNPIGRTGLKGRGILNEWGATQATDNILVRANPRTAVHEVLLIQRADTSEWALPGGKIDPGETAWDAAWRETREEAGLDMKGIVPRPGVSRIIYAGYADDSRNTDNAWMETIVFSSFLDAYSARRTAINAGSDAKDAVWEPINNQLYPTLFGSHGKLLELAIKGHV